MTSERETESSERALSAGVCELQLAAARERAPQISVNCKQLLLIHIRKNLLLNKSRRQGQNDNGEHLDPIKCNPATDFKDKVACELFVFMLWPHAARVDHRRRNAKKH